MKIKREDLIQALKFTMFSISAAVVQIVSYTLIKELTGLNHVWCYIPSLALSVIWNCTFNRAFTFKSAVNINKAILLALLFYVPFAPLSAYAGDLLEKAGWNGYVIEALTMICNFVLEFAWQKFVVFRNRKSEN